MPEKLLDPYNNYISARCEMMKPLELLFFDQMLTKIVDTKAALTTSQ